jgi:hypothetical protein
VRRTRKIIGQSATCAVSILFLEGDLYINLPSSLYHLQRAGEERVQYGLNLAKAEIPAK